MDKMDEVIRKNDAVLKSISTTIRAENGVEVAVGSDDNLLKEHYWALEQLTTLKN